MKECLMKWDRSCVKLMCAAAVLGVFVGMTGVVQARGRSWTPPVSIAVFSDPHLLDPSLLISDGPAFQMYLAQDRKLIAESDAILRSTVSRIRARRPDLCLIPGDLTKDGELASHERVAQYLADSLESVGVQVFVVPGNHDINNEEAYAYDGASVIPVPTVSPDEFEEIYGDMGYDEAFARDPNSLSYVAEPVEGLWVFGIDACKYDMNVGHSETGGRLTPETLAWLTSMLDSCKAEGKTPMALMHHGVMEHYTGQSSIFDNMFADYVIDDWASIRDTLATHGLKVVFTGHYHAQDIVKHETTSGEVIYDIETGSTVTWPSPFRMATFFAHGKLVVTTRRIWDIDYDTGDLPFPLYARNFLEEGLTGIVTAMFVYQFGVPEEQAAELVPFVVRAFMAHYAGDEKPTVLDDATYEALIADPNPLIQAMGLALQSLWTDLAPRDRNLVIDLDGKSPWLKRPDWAPKHR
ncbi:MAG: metallophosphoesterase [Chitinivibrionales bacterium]|nr:metallophosphoesterase [Chitinivibrionales bacterium]MBD3358747.1 metallophosphoesterase [Chitinivibrionales bacterium]